MLWEPIETRYRRENKMFHSSGFAIAAGVVAVGAAATSAAVSMSASDRAAKASAAQGKKYTKSLNKATKQFNKQQQQLKDQVAAIDPTINIPEYNLQNATLEGIEAANKVTANTLKQIERIAPGSEQARLQTGNIIASYLRGEVPQDVREQTQRMLAETGGAGFNFATAGQGMGIQAPQANLARSLGLTSLQLQQTGMEANWKNTAQAFAMQERPAVMMGIALQGRGQDITVAQANIQNRMRQAEMIGNINAQLYNAATGQAQQVYNVGQQNIENTLAARQAIASGVSDIGQATSGALMGVSGAYGQLAQAGAGGIGGSSGGSYKVYDESLGRSQIYNPRTSIG